MKILKICCAGLGILAVSCCFADEKAEGWNIESDYGTHIYVKGPSWKDLRKKRVSDILADATKGDLKSQCMAARLYINGFRVKKNLEKAREWLEKAAEAEDARAQLLLANLLRGYFNGADDEKVVRWSSKGYIGETPIEVNSIAPNFEKSWYWYQKAAKNGNANAIYSMGIMYEKGKFVNRTFWGRIKEIEQPFFKKNLKKAVECYEKAASLGLMAAKVHLANMHFLGLGVPKNLKKAKKIYEEVLQTRTLVATLESSDEEIEAYYKSLFNRNEVEKILDFIERQNVTSTSSKDWQKMIPVDGWELTVDECGLGEDIEYGSLWFPDLVGDRDMKKANSNWDEVFKKAEQGDVKSQYLAGEYYGTGWNGEEDFEKSREWFEKAAAGGDIFSKRALGDLYAGAFSHVSRDVGQGDNEKALYWYKKAAEAGDIDSLRFLGTMYAKGYFSVEWFRYNINVKDKVVEKNPKKAVECFQKAVDLGDLRSLVRLANMHFLGYGISKNRKKAAELYKSALKNLGTQGYLWDIFLGLTREKRAKRAINWIDKEKICELLGKIFIEQEKQGGNLMRKEAFEYLKEAAKGHGVGSRRAGQMLLLLPNLSPKEKKWIFKYALKGYNQAKLFRNDYCFLLGVCYEFGIGTKQDYVKAFEKYQEAARTDAYGGGVASQHYLAYAYFKGHGTEKNIKKGFEWEVKAAKKGIPQAEFNVGTCYLYGHGVEKNKEKAREWLKKAADHGYGAAIKLQRSLGDNSEI